MTTDRTAILAAAAERRALRIRDGVKLGADGQTATLAETTKKPVKGAKTPKAPREAKPKKDKVERTPRATVSDETLSALITKLYAENPGCTASRMVALVRGAGTSCNQNRIKATFVSVTGVTGRTTAKATTTDGESEAEKTAKAKAKVERTETAKAQCKALKAWEKTDRSEPRPDTTVYDEMNREYEAREQAKKDRAAAERAAEEAATAKPKGRGKKAAAEPVEQVATVTPIDKPKRVRPSRAAAAATTPAKPKLVTPIAKTPTAKKGGATKK